MSNSYVGSNVTINAELDIDVSWLAYGINPKYEGPLMHDIYIHNL